MTFSIVGRCERTGQLGVAISSSSIAVGARCPWVRAGVGVVSTQNITLPALGPRVLDLLDAQRSLFTAQQAVVQVRLAQLQNQVSLYKALGGGWNLEAGSIEPTLLLAPENELPKPKPARIEELPLPSVRSDG